MEIGKIKTVEVRAHQEARLMALQPLIYVMTSLQDGLTAAPLRDDLAAR